MIPPHPRGSLNARRAALRRALEDQLLDHCLLVSACKRKVGSDKSHVVTHTAVNSVSSAEGPMCFPSRALILRKPPNPSMRVPRTSSVGIIPTFICGVFVLANDARIGATKGGSSLTATKFGTASYTCARRQHPKCEMSGFEPYARALSKSGLP